MQYYKERSFITCLNITFVYFDLVLGWLILTLIQMVPERVKFTFMSSSISQPQGRVPIMGLQKEVVNGTKMFNLRPNAVD